MRYCKKLFISLLFLVSTFGLIVACGDSNDISTSEDISTPEDIPSSSIVAGVAFKGPISGGTVTIYVLNADGSRGEALAATVTDQNGNFSFNQTFTGPLEVVVSGGTYVDEATGATVDMSGRELQAVVPDGLAEGSSVSVTPLTTIATAQARTRIRNGEEVSSAVSNANTNIANQFGLSGIDITKVVPADFTQNGQIDPNSPEARYGLVLAALSQYSANIGNNPSQLRDIIANLESDMADGTVNSGSNRILFNSLASASSDFLNGAGSGSGVPVGSITITPSPNNPPPAPSPVLGCTDPSATNFNSSATSDDGSCAFPTPGPAPDVTAPTTDVAWSQQDNTAGTSWTGQASLDEAGTGYCTAITNGQAAPSAAEVKADNNANKQGTGGTVAMGTPATTYNCTVTGLTEQTTYDFYFVAEDGVPNLQAAASGPVTATTPDVTAPTTTGALAQNASTVTTWTGQATINEAGTGYITAVINGSGAPTAAAVKADNDADVQGTGCNMAMAANVQNTCQVTGLTTGTTYDFYFVAEDGVPNLQADGSVTTVNATLP